MRTRAKLNNPSGETAVATRQEGSAPAFLRSTGIKPIGNAGLDDMIVPRVKLLQGLSPEVKKSDGELRAGRFYHSVVNEELGKEIRLVPILIQRTYAAWTPRFPGSDEAKLLFSSPDAIHWDKPNQTFEVPLQGNRKVFWHTGRDVESSGLTEWGSSDPDDPKSAPAAQLTYRCIFFLVDRPEQWPVMYIASRTATNSIKDLFTKIQFRGAHQCGQIFKARSVERSRGTNSWYVPEFEADGFVQDEQVFQFLVQQGQTFHDNINRVRAHDETEEQGSESRENRSGNRKF